MKISIIVPCYNEEKNLENLVKEFETNLISKENNIEVILVNNGSTDNSAVVMDKIAEEYKFIKIVTVEVNQGYGYGILSGLRAATGEFLGWIHADLQFNPSEFLKGINYLKQNNYPKDVFIKGIRTNRPFLDKVFTMGMSLYESIILQMRLWDVNAQPTLMPRELFDTWQNPPYDFSFDLYAYYSAKKNKFKVYRYKVVQKERREGKSSWNNGLKSRIKLTKRVIKYSKELKKSSKNEKK